MANEIRTGNLRRFNKGRSSKFREGFRVRQTPEVVRGHMGRNVVKMTIKVKTIVDFLVLLVAQSQDYCAPHKKFADYFYPLVITLHKVA